MMNQQAAVAKADLFRVAFWVIAIPSTLVLSVYATWFAISRYPVPDSDAINLGLFVFSGVVLLDFCFVFDRVVFPRKHRLTPGELARIAGIFIGGALLAALLGLGTWFLWDLASKPWAPQAVHVFMAGWLIAIMWAPWRTRIEEVGSAGLWFVLCGMVLFAGLNLLGAISGDGQEWFRAWQLAVALLLSVPIAKTAMEILKRLRERHSAS